MNNYVNIRLGQPWAESWESFLDEDPGYFSLAFIGADFNFLDAIFGFESSCVENDISALKCGRYFQCHLVTSLLGNI